MHDQNDGEFNKIIVASKVTFSNATDSLLN